MSRRRQKRRRQAAQQQAKPWRQRVRQLIENVRHHAHAQHESALEGWLAEQLRQVEGEVKASDRERLIDTFCTIPGSAGTDLSVVRAYAEGEKDLEQIERDQLLRWEAERRRAVMLVQRCHRDRIEAWDPVEGAALTLHLLDRIGSGQAAAVRRGTVFTAVYLPWIARLVAIGEVEMWSDPEALGMFRREVTGSGRRWHDAPTPAPVRGEQVRG